jgi:hypothetical protein
MDLSNLKFDVQEYHDYVKKCRRIPSLTQEQKDEFKKTIKTLLGNSVLFPEELSHRSTVLSSSPTSSLVEKHPK